MIMDFGSLSRPEVPQIPPPTCLTNLQIPIPMQLSQLLPREPRPQMKPISILRHQELQQPPPLKSIQ
jgi:hypothetical protein